MDEADLSGSRSLGQSPDSQILAEEGSNNVIGGAESERDLLVFHVDRKENSSGEFRLACPLISRIRCWGS